METLVRNSYDEVGGVPGTYRIIDLYCLKEVLNQIMRCSCNSNKGFALYQVHCIQLEMGWQKISYLYMKGFDTFQYLR